MHIEIKPTDDAKAIIAKGISGPSAVNIAKYRDRNPQLRSFTLPTPKGQVYVTVTGSTTKSEVAKSVKSAPVKSPPKGGKFNKTEQGILDGSINAPSKIMAAIDKGSIKYRDLNSDQQAIVRSERSKRAAATMKARKANG